MLRHLGAPLLLAGAALAASPSAQAQEVAPTALQKRLAEQDARIAELEARLAEQGQQIAQLLNDASARSAQPPAFAAASPPVATSALVPAPAPMPVAIASSSAAPASKLAITGDVRLREEFNFSDDDGPDRTRTVFRARLRARYSLSNHWSVGAGITTGDPDDPNSTDVTLSEFADDFTVSLDQAWLRYTAGGLSLIGGKFPNPFTRTEMVWDGDVNPQGLGATYTATLAPGAQIDARAIYFVIDEASGGKDSAMLGGQFAVTAQFSRDWKASLVAAYYDYRLHALTGADAGDFRSNLVAGGRYLSDFNLLDVVGTLTYGGLGERWPLSLTADWVHNSGAVAGRDTGFNFEFAAGRNARPGDWRLVTNYSEVGVDAVFAAFSNDNLIIATNYQLFGLTLEHSLPDGLGLGATFYHYRPLQAAFAGTNDPADWLDRVRLNLTAQF